MLSRAKLLSLLSPGAVKKEPVADSRVTSLFPARVVEGVDLASLVEDCPLELSRELELLPVVVGLSVLADSD